MKRTYLCAVRPPQALSRSSSPRGSIKIDGPHFASVSYSMLSESCSTFGFPF